MKLDAILVGDPLDPILTSLSRRETTAGALSDGYEAVIPVSCETYFDAMMEVVLLLATIGQRFRLTLVPDHPLTLLPAMSLRPRDGIKVVVHCLEAGVARRSRRPTPASFFPMHPYPYGTMIVAIAFCWLCDIKYSAAREDQEMSMKAIHAMVTVSGVGNTDR